MKNSDNFYMSDTYKLEYGRLLRGERIEKEAIENEQEYIAEEERHVEIQHEYEFLIAIIKKEYGAVEKLEQEIKRQEQVKLMMDAV